MTEKRFELDPETRAYLLILRMHGIGDSNETIVKHILWLYIQENVEKIKKGVGREIYEHVMNKLCEIKTNKAKEEMRLILAELEAPDLNT